MAIATEMSLREITGLTIDESLVENLRDRETTIIFDNCEHIVDGVLSTIRLLAQCRSIRIIATSREALRAEGERLVRVPPMALPPGEATAHEANEIESACLFRDRAQLVRPEFEIDEGNCEDICRICRELDGIPLAIELAAAKVNLLSPKQIADRLNDRFKLLRGGHRDALPRHQTLETTIEWSYGMLAAGEQACLRQLAVFPATWNLEMAEAVCQSPDEDPFDFLTILGSLVDKSLVESLDTGRDEHRYRCLESVRQFCRSRSSAAEHEEAKERHYQACLAFAKEADSKLTGPEQAFWIRALEEEHDNLRAALSYGVLNRLATTLELTACLGRFWFARGYFSEGLMQIERCIQALPDLSGVALAKSFNVAGNLAWRSRDLPRAQSFYEMARAEFQRQDDRSGYANALSNLGLIHGDLGNFELAETMHVEALAIRTIANDQFGMANSANNLGVLAWRRGDLNDALRYYQQGIELRRAINDLAGEADTLTNVGLIFRRMGDLKSAQVRYEEALGIFERVGNRAGKAVALENLASLCLEMDDDDAAGTAIARGLEVTDVMGDEDGHHVFEFLRVVLWAKAGDTDAAWEDLYRLEIEGKQVGGLLASVARTRGYILASREKFKEAAIQFGKAEGLVEQSKSARLSERQPIFDHAAEITRVLLGETRWHEHFERGQLEATEYAGSAP